MSVGKTSAIYERNTISEGIEGNCCRKNQASQSIQFEGKGRACRGEPKPLRLLNGLTGVVEISSKIVHKLQ